MAQEEEAARKRMRGADPRQSPYSDSIEEVINQAKVPKEIRDKVKKLITSFKQKIKKYHNLQSKALKIKDQVKQLEEGSWPVEVKKFAPQVEVPELEDSAPAHIMETLRPFLPENHVGPMTVRMAKTLLYDTSVLINKRLDLVMLESQVATASSAISFDGFIQEAIGISNARSTAIENLGLPAAALPPGLFDDEVRLAKHEAVSLYRALLRSIADEKTKAKAMEDAKEEQKNTRLTTLITSTPSMRFAAAVRQVMSGKTSAVDWAAYHTGAAADQSLNINNKDGKNSNDTKRVFTKKQQALRKKDRGSAPRSKNDQAQDRPPSGPQGSDTSKGDPKGKGKGKSKGDPKGKGKNGKDSEMDPKGKGKSKEGKCTKGGVKGDASGGRTKGRGNRR